MNSRIFIGHVMHKRYEKATHSFLYPLYMYAIDLDELYQLTISNKLFGYNKFKPVAIHTKDYLYNKPGDLKEKLMELLTKERCEDNINKIILVTAARYFNYVFNPVSFYYCYKKDGSLRCVVAEVNNTFKEKHVYVLTDQLKNEKWFAKYEAKKVFHVSPFFQIQGYYTFYLTDLNGNPKIRIEYNKNGNLAFVAQLTIKENVALTQKNLLKTIIRFPFTASLTMTKIHWEALKLWMIKKLPFYSKPEPSSEYTLRGVPPSIFTRILMKPVKIIFNKITEGFIIIEVPNGEKWRFGNEKSAIKAILNVKRYRFFRRVCFSGSIGFGEGFMYGDWETDNLTNLLKILCLNLSKFQKSKSSLTKVMFFFNNIMHKLNKNTLFKSRKNIKKHYDLGDDLFSLFLDESRTYSAAYFSKPDESLLQAQHNKIDRIIKKAQISANDHVLEIGSGWGAFAIRASQQTGCGVTTITLSDNQFNYVSERIKKLNLQDKITVLLKDYRSIDGMYDKIVSIEMLEAVGHEYLGAFFKACDTLLKPNGIVVIQVITIPDQRYKQYRKKADWIKKHIFPGGHLPCLNSIVEALNKNTDFILYNLEDIGIHYAKTLRLWREKFLSNISKVKKLGADEVFCLKWEYYLAYCEAAFETRILNDIHMVLTRPGNSSLKDIHL